MSAQTKKAIQALLEASEREPGLRLGQLVATAADPNPYYVTDEQLAIALSADPVKAAAAALLIEFDARPPLLEARHIAAFRRLRAALSADLERKEA